MEKYTSTKYFENCPNCSKLLELYVNVSWNNFEPEKLNCPFCKTPLFFTSDGKLLKE